MSVSDSSYLHFLHFLHSDLEISQMASPSPTVMKLEQVGSGNGLYWYVTSLEFIKGDERGNNNSGRVTTQRCLVDTGSYCIALEGSVGGRGQGSGEPVVLQYHDGDSHLERIDGVFVAESARGKLILKTPVAHRAGKGGLNFQKKCDGVLGLLPSPDPYHMSAVTHSSHNGLKVQTVCVDFANDRLILNAPPPRATLLSLKCDDNATHLKATCDIILHLTDGSLISYSNMPCVFDTGTTYSISFLRGDHSLIEACNDSRRIHGVTLRSGWGGRGDRTVLMTFPSNTLYPPCVPRNLTTFRPQVVLLGLQAFEGNIGKLHYSLNRQSTFVDSIHLLP